MANTISYKDKSFGIGDTIALSYRIKDGDKERQQMFEGILTKVRGNDLDNRMITVRKVSHSGVGIERIIPLASPFISEIKLVKKASYRKAKLYFLRPLSGAEVRQKIYKSAK